MRSGYAEHGLAHPRLHREGDYVVSRARLLLATNPVDAGGGVMVSATFVPQAAYTFGESGTATPTLSDHPALQLYEGFASVGTSAYRLDVGRFMLDYGDALVIGNLGWNELGRAFNGARVRLTPLDEPIFIDAFVTLLDEGRTTSQEPVAGDTYFYGVYAGLGALIDKAIDWDVYALGLSVADNEELTVADPMDATNTAPADRDGATEITLGSRLRGKLAPIDYRAEAGLQFGRRTVQPSFARPAPDARSKLGYQIDAELGVTPVPGFRVGVEGLIASGDDPTTPDEDEGYNELFPTAHKFLGLMDVIGPRTNIASAVLHLNVAALDPLLLALDLHHFSRLEPGADGKDGTVGQELNFNALYTIGAGASLRGLYGIFLPDEGFWETKAPDPDEAGDALHYVEVQFSYEFK